MTSPVVLVVDDDEGVLYFLTSALALYGFRVLAAAGGPQALELIGQSVDLVLTDIMMPGMDGIALAAEIRKLHPRVPIILMSGGELRLDPAVAPLYTFIGKPFELNSLVGIIRDQLTGIARQPAQSEVADQAQDAAERRERTP